ncbi:alpha/beta hydrolase [Kribbella qitaiheensis]|uniref:Alpha/beta hydrolase n=1 Tax=Kribbella qitaiheensis TaxID=1544730 RepID=A0A7G6XA98_9ACTN|nr:alpha/beta hydrolase [Kribbella qitaiheensis]
MVLPGGMYGPHAPLLMYAADAAERRGATIRHISWDDPEGPWRLTPEGRGPWVLDQFERAVPDVPAGALLIAKSLGTHVAVVAAERELPAVWLTPVLTSEFVVDALRRSTAPFLLVGGTADELWDSGLARELTPYVLEVDGADHGMYVPGRLAASAAVLGQTATAVEDFLDQVVWA